MSTIFNVLPLLDNNLNARMFHEKNVGFLSLNAVFPFEFECANCKQKVKVPSEGFIWFVPFSYSLWWKNDFANVTAYTPHTFCGNEECRERLVLVSEGNTVVSYLFRSQEQLDLVTEIVRIRVDKVHGNPRKWRTELRDSLNWRINTVDYSNKH